MHRSLSDQQSLLYRITHRIRRSLDLQEILDAAVAEVQQFLGMDRIKIYQFRSDASGQVVAEYLGPDRRLPSLHGLNFPAADIPPQARHLFMEARVRNIVDVKAGLIGQSRLRDPITGEPIAEDWAFRPLDPCHQEYLMTMGVGASLGTPIFHHDQLWGLLVAHHVEPKEIPYAQLQGIQWLVDQLSMAIAQATFVIQAQAKAERETTISRVTTLLQSLTTIEFQPALEATIASFQGSGGRLFIHPEAFHPPLLATVDHDLKIYTCGRQPLMSERIQPDMEYCHGIQTHFQAIHEPWAITDIYQVSELRILQAAFRPTPIRSLLLVPLVLRQQIIGYLSIFRDEFATETLWAGRCDADDRQDLPRQSFASWRQTQTGLARPWLDSEVTLAQTLAGQFATAIEQYDLHQQVQNLNAHLETQVQERTAELQRANQHLQETLVELKQAQMQLIQTEKMSSLGQLVAGVAHEINNPISFIHGNTTHVIAYMQTLLSLVDYCQERYGKTDAELQAWMADFDLDFIAMDLRKVMSSIEKGTNRIREIVLSLRNFSRLDEADMKFVNIHEGIDSTLLILQYRLKGTIEIPEIQIIKQYGNLPLVECHASQINQVLMNVLTNAIESIERRDFDGKDQILSANSSTITITTQLHGTDQIHIAITDTGIGMTDETKAKLFDPFYTTKPVGKGTGLGLAISYQIITKRHGGTIQCSSTQEQGSQFVIIIPVRQSSRQRSFIGQAGEKE
jgi:light-regulated signal transduction histidine kinase (bacteriophytochrome)